MGRRQTVSQLRFVADSDALDDPMLVLIAAVVRLALRDAQLAGRTAKARRIRANARMFLRTFGIQELEKYCERFDD
jgi:hypothetical protein